MLRKQIISLSTWAKTRGVFDIFLRYNPLVIKKITNILAKPTESMTAYLMNRTLGWARNTKYGMHYGANYENWPLLDKEVVRTNPGDFINTRTIPSIPADTSGTTGRPMKMRRSLECVAAEQIFIDRMLSPYSFKSSRIAVLRTQSFTTQDPNMPHGIITHGGTRLTLSSPHIGPDTIAWYHKALTEFKADIFSICPNAGLNLLTMLRNSGLNYTVPVVLSSSEVMPAALFEELAQSLKTKVINYYGQAERTCLAVSTEPEKFYFVPEYGHVEFLETDLHSENADLYEIVATSFWNSAMPLVRYKTGDIIMVPKGSSQKELAEIACGAKPFSELLGRDNEYLIAPDGVRVLGMSMIARSLERVFQTQIIQHSPAEVTVLIFPTPGFTTDDELAVLAAAKATIPNKIAVRTQVVDSLRTNANGKAPSVIREFENK